MDELLQPASTSSSMEVNQDDDALLEPHQIVSSTEVNPMDASPFQPEQQEEALYDFSYDDDGDDIKLATASQDGDESNMSALDLYTDMVVRDSEEAALSLAKLKEEKTSFKAQLDEALIQVSKLTTENEVLKKENQVLRSNISVLLKTAKMELQRKERELKEFREMELGGRRPTGVALSPAKRKTRRLPRQHQRPAPLRQNGVHKGGRRDGNTGQDVKRRLGESDSDIELKPDVHETMFVRRQRAKNKEQSAGKIVESTMQVEKAPHKLDSAKSRIGDGLMRLSEAEDKEHSVEYALRSRLGDPRNSTEMKASGREQSSWPKDYKDKSLPRSRSREKSPRSQSSEKNLQCRSSRTGSNDRRSSRSKSRDRKLSPLRSYRGKSHEKESRSRSKSQERRSFGPLRKEDTSQKESSRSEADVRRSKSEREALVKQAESLAYRRSRTTRESVSERQRLSDSHKYRDHRDNRRSSTPKRDYKHRSSTRSKEDQTKSSIDRDCRLLKRGHSRARDRMSSIAKESVAKAKARLNRRTSSHCSPRKSDDKLRRRSSRTLCLDGLTDWVNTSRRDTHSEKDTHHGERQAKESRHGVCERKRKHRRSTSPHKSLKKLRPISSTDDTVQSPSRNLVESSASNMCTYEEGHTVIACGKKDSIECTSSKVSVPHTSVSDAYDTTQSERSFLFTSGIQADAMKQSLDETGVNSKVKEEGELSEGEIVSDEEAVKRQNEAKLRSSRKKKKHSPKHRHSRSQSRSKDSKKPTPKSVKRGKKHKRHSSSDQDGRERKRRLKEIKQSDDFMQSQTGESNEKSITKNIEEQFVDNNVLQIKSNLNNQEQQCLETNLEHEIPSSHEKNLEAHPQTDIDAKTMITMIVSEPARETCIDGMAKEQQPIGNSASPAGKMIDDKKCPSVESMAGNFQEKDTSAKAQPLPIGESKPRDIPMTQSKDFGSKGVSCLEEAKNIPEPWHEATVPDLVTHGYTAADKPELQQVAGEAEQESQIEKTKVEIELQNEPPKVEVESQNEAAECKMDTKYGTTEADANLSRGILFEDLCLSSSMDDTSYMSCVESDPGSQRQNFMNIIKKDDIQAKDMHHSLDKVTSLEAEQNVNPPELLEKLATDMDVDLGKLTSYQPDPCKTMNERAAEPTDNAMFDSKLCREVSVAEVIVVEGTLKNYCQEKAGEDKSHSVLNTPAAEPGLDETMEFCDQAVSELNDDQSDGFNHDKDAVSILATSGDLDSFLSDKTPKAPPKDIDLSFDDTKDVVKETVTMDKNDSLLHLTCDWSNIEFHDSSTRTGAEVDAIPVTVNASIFDDGCAQDMEYASEPIQIDSTILCENGQMSKTLREGPQLDNKIGEVNVQRTERRKEMKVDESCEAPRAFMKGTDEKYRKDLSPNGEEAEPIEHCSSTDQQNLRVDKDIDVAMTNGGIIPEEYPVEETDIISESTKNQHSLDIIAKEQNLIPSGEKDDNRELKMSNSDVDRACYQRVRKEETNNLCQPTVINDEDNSLDITETDEEQEASVYIIDIQPPAKSETKRDRSESEDRELAHLDSEGSVLNTSHETMKSDMPSPEPEKEGNRETVIDEGPVISDGAESELDWGSEPDNDEQEDAEEDTVSTTAMHEGEIKETVRSVLEKCNRGDQSVQEIDTEGEERTDEQNHEDSEEEGEILDDDGEDDARPPDQSNASRHSDDLRLKDSGSGSYKDHHQSHHRSAVHRSSSRGTRDRVERRIPEDRGDRARSGSSDKGRDWRTGGKEEGRKPSGMGRSDKGALENRSDDAKRREESRRKAERRREDERRRREDDRRREDERRRENRRREEERRRENVRRREDERRREEDRKKEEFLEKKREKYWHRREKVVAEEQRRIRRSEDERKDARRLEDEEKKHGVMNKGQKRDENEKVRSRVQENEKKRETLRKSKKISEGRKP